MVKSNDYLQLAVKLPEREYPIYIGNSLLSNTQLIAKHIAANQVLIVSNDKVAPLYLASLQGALNQCQVDVVILADGESNKNQHSLFTIYNALIEKQHHRDTTLIALGGGVVGDITGFAAATFHRGVRFIQIPTTLLAQVDASVGGKTAINHPLGKNLIGSFHQPHAVIIDLATLKTLPLREFRAGLAEVIKYGLLAGGVFLKQLIDMLHADFNQTSPQLVDIIATCCQIKASFVQSDERELGSRALLNLGHTFAHALEACTQYKRWLHGEAVAIGLYCAALLSNHLGYLEKKYVNQIDNLLEAASLPRRIPQDIDTNQLFALLFNDKKIKNNKLRFVLLRSPGDCYVDEKVPLTSVQCVIAGAVQGN